MILSLKDIYKITSGYKNNVRLKYNIKINKG